MISLRTPVHVDVTVHQTSTLALFIPGIGCYLSDIFAALYEITKLNEEVIRSTCMITMDAIDHAMMKEFHEPGNIKRSVVVIPHERIEQWLAWKNPNIMTFMQGFPVEEFECFYCPQQRQAKNSPQLNMFDDL